MLCVTTYVNNYSDSFTWLLFFKIKLLTAYHRQPHRLKATVGSYKVARPKIIMCLKILRFFSRTKRIYINPNPNPYPNHNPEAIHNPNTNSNPSPSPEQSIEKTVFCP